MRERDDLTFSMNEHRRRLGELRERMARRGLDSVLISDPENLCYLTEHQTTGYSYLQALVVPLEHEPFMVTRRLERSNVEARTWVERSYDYDDTADAIAALSDAIRGAEVPMGRLGIERSSYFLPAHHRDRLEVALPDTDIVDCWGIVEEGRITKSAEEIEVMRKAAYATEQGMAAGFEATEAGATENEIAAAICAAMFRAGSEYPAVLPYVTSGPRTMIGHATWEGRVVEPGDTVFLEVAGCIRRYHSAMMRTAFVGEPPPEVLGAEKLVLDALDAMIDGLRPGITVSDADKLARDILDQSTVGGSLVTRAGYAIGIAFAPSWDEGYIMSLKPGDRRVLDENMTFHLIPWLFGYEGNRVMGISETVRITADGAEPLAELPRGLVVRT